MTKREGKAEIIGLKGLLARDQDFVRAAIATVMQAALEAEMTTAMGAAKGERSETRLSYRSGYYGRLLVTRECGRWNCGYRRIGWGGELVGIELLRAPAELHALQLAKQVA